MTLPLWVLLLSEGKRLFIMQQSWPLWFYLPQNYFLEWSFECWVTFTEIFYFFVWICTLNCIWLIGVCTVYCCLCLKSKSPQLLLVNNCFVVESHCQSCCVLREVWKWDCAPGVLIALKSRFTCFPLLPSHNERGMLGYLNTRLSFLGWEQKCWLCSGLLGIPRVQVQPLQHPLENKPFELGKSLVPWPL